VVLTSLAQPAITIGNHQLGKYKASSTKLKVPRKNKDEIDNSQSSMYSFVSS
jgi:hypothetical protein